MSLSWSHVNSSMPSTGPMDGLKTVAVRTGKGAPQQTSEGDLARGPAHCWLPGAATTLLHPYFLLLCSRYMPQRHQGPQKVAAPCPFWLTTPHIDRSEETRDEVDGRQTNPMTMTRPPAMRFQKKTGGWFQLASERRGKNHCVAVLYFHMGKKSPYIAPIYANTKTAVFFWISSLCNISPETLNNFWNARNTSTNLPTPLFTNAPDCPTAAADLTAKMPPNANRLVLSHKLTQAQTQGVTLKWRSTCGTLNAALQANVYLINPCTHPN